MTDNVTINGTARGLGKVATTGDVAQCEVGSTINYSGFFLRSRTFLDKCTGIEEDDVPPLGGQAAWSCGLRVLGRPGCSVMSQAAAGGFGAQL